nr:hypothetical protein [Tanacetum cinerariifolium]
DKAAQALEISKLKRRVKKLEKGNRVKGRMIDDLDRDEDVVFLDDKEKEKKAKEAKVAGDDQHKHQVLPEEDSLVSQQVVVEPEVEVVVMAEGIMVEYVAPVMLMEDLEYQLLEQQHLEPALLHYLLPQSLLLLACP